MASVSSPNCSIDPRAEIDDDVEIGPFCVIGPQVRIGRGTRLENNVTLMGRVTIGRDNHIFPGVVIGGASARCQLSRQRHAGRSSATTTCIREAVTVNRASEKEDGITSIGSHNFLMAC